MQKSKKKLVVERQNKLVTLTDEQLHITNGGGGGSGIPTVVDGNRARCN